MKKILVLLLLIPLISCASFSRNALNTLNASRDTYNYAASVAVSNQCERDENNREINDGTCITYQRWTKDVRPALVNVNRTINDGYASLKAYNQAKTKENKSTLEAVLASLGPLIQTVKDLLNIQ